MGATIARGEFSGEAGLRVRGRETVTVQYAGHTEVVTGERRVLFVALSTSRGGATRGATRTDGHARASRRASARSCDWWRPERPGPRSPSSLHISHATVRTHVRNAMAKVGARSRAHLVAKALGDGHSAGIARAGQIARRGSSLRLPRAAPRRGSR